MTKMIEIISPDEELASIIARHQARIRRSSASVRKVNGRTRHPARNGHEVLCVSPLEHIDRTTASAVRGIKGRKRWVLLCAPQFPQEAIPSRLEYLGIRDPSNVYVHTAPDRRRESEFLGRLVSTLGTGEPDQRILDAFWLNDLFIVTSSSFNRIEVRAHQLSCLRGKSPEALRRFEIDGDGSFVFWPDLDVHLGWDQFTQSADPAAYVKARQKTQAFNQSYGKAIRQIRDAARLTQSDIPGLTPRQVSRIEKGECRATANALKKLATAHGLEVNDYLSRLARALG